MLSARYVLGSCSVFACYSLVGPCLVSACYLLPTWFATCLAFAWYSPGALHDMCLAFAEHLLGNFLGAAFFFRESEPPWGRGRRAPLGARPLEMLEKLLGRVV